MAKFSSPEHIKHTTHYHYLRFALRQHCSRRRRQRHPLRHRRMASPPPPTLVTVIGIWEGVQSNPDIPVIWDEGIPSFGTIFGIALAESSLSRPSAGGPRRRGRRRRLKMWTAGRTLLSPSAGAPARRGQSSTTPPCWPEPHPQDNPGLYSKLLQSERIHATLINMFLTSVFPIPSQNIK